MVQEVRSILFTAEECRTAITQLLAMRAGAARPGTVTGVKLQGPKVSAVVTFGSNAGATQHLMDAADLMSAVLLFCRKARIPLSTRSDKRLSLISDCLALTTSINLRPTTSTNGSKTTGELLTGPDLALMHTM